MAHHDEHCGPPHARQLGAPFLFDVRVPLNKRQRTACYLAYLLSDAVWSLSVGPPLRPDMWAHHAAGALLLATAAAAWRSHPGPINAAARALLWMESTTPFLNASWLVLWPWTRLAGPSKAIAAVWGAFAGAGAPLAELARLPVVVLLYLVATLLLAGLQVVWGAVLAKRFRARGGFYR